MNIQKDQILRTAVGKNLDQEQIGENCASSFSMLHDCMSVVDSMELTEEQKKEKLICYLQSFWRGRSRNVAGCKREHVQKIICEAFGIRNENDKHFYAEIRSFTFKQLYLYYCYIERLAKGDSYISQLLREHYNNKPAKTVAQKREEQQIKKEEKIKEEKEKIEEMSKEERWRYEIFEKQQDIPYFSKLDDSGAYSEEDRVLIAALLKEYWQTIEKWECNKVSKKQAVKINKVKGILGE